MRNRSKILVLVLASLVSACSPSTPLTDALAALRRGDREALLLAKEDALAALRTAAPACTFDGEDLRMRAEVATINRLDNTKLFDLPEHERLVYAVNVIVAAGQDYYEIEYAERANCATIVIQTSATATPQKGIAVRRALDSWFAAEISRQGKNYKTNMAQAAKHLTSVGLPARWPLPTGPQVTTIGGITVPCPPGGPCRPGPR